MSNLIGWALPAYLSVKALETPGHQDDIQWLTYWVVFGFFNFLESFALRVVLYYFPWYFAFKSLFILWLQLPAFRVRILSHVPLRDVNPYSYHSVFFSEQGAQVLYGTVVKPVFVNVHLKTSSVTTTTTEPAAGSE